MNEYLFHNYQRSLVPAPHWGRELKHTQQIHRLITGMVTSIIKSHKMVVIGVPTLIRVIQGTPKQAYHKVMTDNTIKYNIFSNTCPLVRNYINGDNSQGIRLLIKIHGYRLVIEIQYLSLLLAPISVPKRPVGIPLSEAQMMTSTQWATTGYNKYHTDPRQSSIEYCVQ